VRRARQVTSLLVMLLVLAIGPFGLGYALGHADAIGRSHTAIEPVLRRVGLARAVPEPAPVPAPSPELDAIFRPFWEAWGYVDRDFYDESAVEPHKLSRGAIRGMLTALDDQHTLYLDPTHREITDADLRGAFDGIGVQVEMEGDDLHVVSPLDGSPGQRAGLRAGDVITRVDGSDVHGISLLDAIQMIRGPRGSTVTLTIVRGGAAPFDVKVAREEIRVPSVRGELRPDGVAYIRISSFALRVGSDLREVLDQLAQRSPRGWVLDLRGNPGGYLDGAVAVTSQFIDEGVVLYEERRGAEREAIRTRGRPRALSGPMAVMVDSGTASAAEIVAGALRDHGRATLVGEQTYGKGTVQIVHTLSDGGALRLTVARWLTPDGSPIQGVGLTPQIPVVAAAGADAALQQAVDFVRQQPASAAAPLGGQRAVVPMQVTPGQSVRDWLSLRDDAEASILDAREEAALGAPVLG